MTRSPVWVWTELTFVFVYAIQVTKLVTPKEAAATAAGEDVPDVNSLSIAERAEAAAGNA